MDGGLVHADLRRELGFSQRVLVQEVVEGHSLRNMHLVHMQVNHIYASSSLQSDRGMAQFLAMPKGNRRKTFLREWRRMKPGRTLEQVAEHLHISQPQLGRIERGDQPYNQDLLEALAELYGCDVADLLMRDPTKPDAIWSLWDQAKPGQRRVIEAAAAAILKSDAA